MQTGNNDFQKRANLALVANSICRNGVISRAQLSKELGLIRSTVSNLVNVLQGLNVVEELDFSQSTSKGGRKGILLGIRGSAGVVAGIETSFYNFRFVLVNIKGELVFKSDFTEIDTNDFTNFFFNILKTVEDKVKSLSLKLIGVSAGISGIIDRSSGVILSSDDYCLTNYEFYKNIGSKYSYPIIIENDSRACAWGFSWLNPDIETFYYLYSRPIITNDKNSYGIGLGIVVNGKVHGGKNYRSGELSVANDDDVNSSYIDMFEMMVKNKISSADEITERFGDVLSNLLGYVSLMDPDLLAVGHGWEKCFNLLKMSLIKYMSENRSGNNWCDISLSNLSDVEVAHGAALGFLKELYSIPQVGEKESVNTIDWEKTFS